MGFSLPQLWFIFRRVSESPWNPLLLRHSLAQPTSRQISQAYCFMKLASFCSEARAQNTAPFLCSTAQVPEMLTSSQTHSPITSSPLLLFSCIRATLGIPRDSRSWFPHWFWHTTPGKPEERMQGVTFLRLFTINTPLILPVMELFGLAKNSTLKITRSELWKSSFPYHLISAAHKEMLLMLVLFTGDLIFLLEASGIFSLYFWNCPLWAGVDLLICCVRHSVGLFNLGNVFLFS